MVTEEDYYVDPFMEKQKKKKGGGEAHKYIFTVHRRVFDVRLDSAQQQLHHLHGAQAGFDRVVAC